MHNQLTQTITSVTDEISELVAHKVMADQSMVYPFSEFTETLTNLFQSQDAGDVGIITAGHLTPELEIAASRASMEIKETLGSSPFAGNVQNTLEAVQSKTDVIYVANPNRVTGASLSTADLETLAKAVPNGLLVVDEFFFDFFGISGFALLDRHTNIVVIRSFAAPFGIYSSDSGYLLGSQRLVSELKNMCGKQRFSQTVGKIIRAVLSNDEAMSARLQEVHDESLAIAEALGKAGVQCRITPTDFILIRVADPTRVGNFLASNKVAIENLDGYPEMKNYIKYRIQSKLSNERMLESFAKMPTEYFQMVDLDRREISMHTAIQTDDTLNSKNDNQPNSRLDVAMLTKDSK